jgi:hypothetical protein
MLQHAALEAGVDFDAVLLDDDADLLAEIVDDHLARELRSAPPAWVRYLQDVGKVNRASLTTLARTVSGMPALHLQPDLSASRGPVAGLDRRAGALPPHLAGRRPRPGGGVDPADEGGRGSCHEGPADLHGEGRGRVVDIDTWLGNGPAGTPGAGQAQERRTGSPTIRCRSSPPRRSRPSWRRGPLVPDLEVLDASARLIDAAVLPATLFRYRAATWMWAELDRRKRQRTVLTYDDLLRRLADALDRPATRDAVRESIRQRYASP